MPIDRVPILSAQGLWAGYRGVSCVRDLNIEVSAGEIVVVLGPNGAGKTTTLLTMAGAIPAIRGQILWDGHPTTAPLHMRVRDGLGMVPEERSIVSKLSTADNLKLGQGLTARALELFPELGTLMRRKAGLLSGGEQRILAMARALAAEPRVLLADELSLGLAPKIVSRLMLALRDAAERGAGVLLVEQQANHALAVSDRVYILRRGNLVWRGSSAEARERLTEIEDAYLGRSTDLDVDHEFSSTPEPSG